jgi:hypothetical protein
LFILGTAATTLPGAFDPFDEMADIDRFFDNLFDTASKLV